MKVTNDEEQSVARVFCLAIILDILYQLIVFHWVYPLEALIMAFVLALLPYLLLGGPVNRIARLLLAGGMKTDEN